MLYQRPHEHFIGTAGGTVRILRMAMMLAVGLLLAGGQRAEAATNLFISGQGGYNTYRIPALYETTNGTLLAFCEGRVNSSSDTGNIDTVLRRSFDGGATWTAQQVVWSDGANTCGNPTVVQDDSNGRIWVFMTWNNGSDTQTEIQNGTSIDVRKIYSCYSDNDGATWSTPVNRFAEVQPPTTRWDATGPGRGIQMVNGSYPGRLIIPANGRNIHSDDHGATWTQSTWLPSGSSESQIVEISGGVLLRNDRATGGNTAYNARIFCRGSNQGASWGALEVRQDLTCPICQASTIAVDHPDGVDGRMLVFSNPSATTRVNMTIQCSLDDGATWPFSQQVYSGSSAYSCLTKIGANHIGLLYERDSYGKITFDKFAIATLVPNAPTNQPARTWQGAAGMGNEQWQQPANWNSNSAPIFDSGLDVIFHAIGAGNLTNAIGDNRTLRSLIFNDVADANISIQLAETVVSPATNHVLTFAAILDSATNSVSSGATGNFTVGGGGFGSITLANNLVVNHAGSGTLTFDRPISETGGARSLTKNGTGTLTLRQNNTYTGATIVSAGTLLVGNTTSCGTGPLILSNNVTFASNTGGSRSPVNNVTLGGNVTLGQASGGTGALNFTGAFDLGGATRILTINSPVTLSGVVSNGGLTKNGTNTLALAGTNTFTGPVTLFAGSLQLGNGGVSGSLADTVGVAIGPTATLHFNRSSSDASFPNPLSGSGTVLKSLVGIEFGLTGTNTFSGLIDIQEGKLAFAGADSENGQPGVNIATNGTLSIGGGFIGGTATIGNLTGAGRIDPAFTAGAGTRTLQVNQTTDGEFSGVLADGTSGRVLALTKVGLAILTLSGTNTNTGPTTVSNGTLLVTGSLSSTTVTVSGGTLAGTGTLGGAVNVRTGGTLSPGTSAIGKLTVSNSVSLAGGSLTVMKLSRNGGVATNDLALVSGMLTQNGSLVVTNIGTNALLAGDSFKLFTAGTYNTAFTNLTLPALTGGLTWNTSTLATNGTLSVVVGSTYTLTYTAGTNGSLTGSTNQTVSPGANGSEVTAVADSGYHFVNWSDGSVENPRTDANVTNNLTVTANFAINTYTLNYTAGANGSISGTSPQLVNHGASGSAVTAVPTSGYGFTNWSDGLTLNPRTDANVTNDLTVTANFVAVESGALPVPWTTNKIGTVTANVSATYTSGTFNVTGGGANISGKNDNLWFVNQPWSGDVTLTARVASQQNTGSAAKAGVMIRESTATGSRSVFMGLTPTSGAQWVRRSNTGGSSSTTTSAGKTAPYWVRLTRSGNTFTGYISTNGTSWVQVASASISMAGSYGLGLAVCSGSSSTTNLSVFDSVSVTNTVMAGAPLVAPSRPTIGPLTLGNEMVSFSITNETNSTWLLQDSTNGVTWTPLQTITINDGAVQHSEADDRRALRLFRLQSGE